MSSEAAYHFIDDFVISRYEWRILSIGNLPTLGAPLAVGLGRGAYLHLFLFTCFT